ncbi:hypothetical protein P154DRAFT_523032 [Amniculicola lignicola CBS 123094]|uniref:DUF7924 domain-containing protein n=1 Tax=Amniculicola lignicola CBS 123094 TaxID=1392246 RepID=A0A6A5WQ32_9PLEO|nr:hypothetical protein P154DRAFT_523032 [Amniculicola lignicola CBS 123094]
MNRTASEEIRARKRRRTVSCDCLPIPEIGHDCLHQQASITPPEPSFKLSLDNTLQAETEWSQRAQSIAAWVCNTSESPPPCQLPPANNDSPVLEAMSSESSRFRDVKAKIRRPRSCSPTKKSSQYRNTLLKPARIRVDVVHNIPANVAALLPHRLRNDIPDTIDTLHEEGNDDVSPDLDAIANNYLEECRELAGKPGSEPAYRMILYDKVIKILARHPPWRRTLSDNISDKLWNVSLKPPLPPPVVLPQTWIPLLPNHALLKPTQDMRFVESTQNSFDSNVERVRPDHRTFDTANPPFSPEPSESSTSSHLDSMLSTPKPDITVGISPDVFRPSHEGMLKAWQADNIVLSDPHTQLGDMRFPFLVIETKGLATDSNMIGAQNQAAGGGTCALRALESFEAQMLGVATVPRIVFSVTTEGALHELWVHYRIIEGEDVHYHMTCLGAWRTTLSRHANDFVSAIASIFQWSVDVYFQQIEQALDIVLRGGS